MIYGTNYPCIQQDNLMTQITTNNVFEKIRSISKQCRFSCLPERFTGTENIEIIQTYLKTLESIRIELLKFYKLEEEYQKLEKLLQREQTELRRRIGIENQMKLYIEALKQENEQLEKEKLEFLDNTKNYIKQLKKINQNLFIELTAEMNKNKANPLETMDKSNKKFIKQKITDINKSLNKNKPKRDKSIKDIVKTQFIEREKLNTETKKTRKIHHYKLHSSIMSDNERDNHLLQQNLRTFQEYNNTDRTDHNTKKNNQQLKANSQLLSNQTITNFFDQSKISAKKIERDKIVKTPIKLEKRDNFNKNRAENPSRHLSRERKHNRSVYSVLSAEQIQNQKEFL